MHQPHPAATAFPLLAGDEYQRLVDDIRVNGLLDEIVLYDGLTLDGRNRERACEDAKVKPRYRNYTGDDPIGFVVSTNLYRRHLNESQRAMAAERLATLKHGEKRGKSASLTVGDAAGMLKVGERTVKQARQVRNDAEPEVVEAVERGELSLNRASEIAKLSRDQQAEALADAKAQEPRRTTNENRDRMMTREIKLGEADIKALQALALLGADSDDLIVRAGVKALVKIVPVLAFVWEDR